MIEIKNVTLGYDKQKPLFKNLNLKLHRGHITCIIAPRGSGKTTLLNTLTGNKYVFSGEVKINGIDNESKFQQNECKLLHHNYHLYNNLTVLGNVKFRQVMEGFDLSDNEIKTQLIIHDLYEQQNHSVENLSLFKKRQLSLMLTLLSNPNYILLDEPTTRLTNEEKERYWTKLRDLASAGKAVVVVANSSNDILDYDRAIVLNTGKVIWDEVSNYAN